MRSNQVDKYSIPSESINKDRFYFFEDFLENEMDYTPLDYDFLQL
jgi:hypothetical protein